MEKVKVSCIESATIFKFVEELKLFSREEYSKICYNLRTAIHKELLQDCTKLFVSSFKISEDKSHIILDVIDNEICHKFLYDIKTDCIVQSTSQHVAVIDAVARANKRSW